MRNLKLFFLFLILTAALFQARPASGKTTHKILTTFKADLKWGAGGTGEGMFQNPKAICVDASDNVYVLDNGNDRIQKFDADGKFIDSYDNFEQVPDNFYLNFKTGDLKSIQVDKSGNFFFMSPYAGFGYTPDKKFIFGHVTGGDMTAGYTISRNGYLYYLSSNNGGCIFKTTRGGKLAVQYPDTASSPVGVGVDSQGNVYVLSAYSANSLVFGIQKYGSNGDPLLQWGKYGLGKDEFSFFSGITVDDEDHIYVLDGGENVVRVYNPDGSLWVTFGETGIAQGQLRLPTGIAVNSKGQVYVLDGGNNRVERFTRTQVDETLGPHDKILKKIETALLDILLKVKIDYDGGSDITVTASVGVQPMAKPAGSDPVGSAVGDAAKKALGF